MEEENNRDFEIILTGMIATVIIALFIVVIFSHPYIEYSNTEVPEICVGDVYNKSTFQTAVNKKQPTEPQKVIKFMLEESNQQTSDLTVQEATEQCISELPPWYEYYMLLQCTDRKLGIDRH